MKLKLDQITSNKFPRDRTVITPDKLEELERSLLRNGLRTPIEVWKCGETYELISGLRRLTAFERLSV